MRYWYWSVDVIIRVRALNCTLCLLIIYEI